MTPEVAFVLGLLVLAIILLATEALTIEMVALLLVAALAASGVLSAEAAFTGFASETVIMLACVMVLSHRLSASGLVAGGIRRLLEGRQMGQRRTSAVLMTVSAALSSFMTNTSTTAILIPAVSELSKRTNVHPGRYLMPMAFASMMGGSATLIGTSTNLAASGAAERLGLAPFGIFEFAAVGVIVSIVGITLLVVLGGLLLPSGGLTAHSAAQNASHFMTTLTVPTGSDKIGLSIKEIDFGDVTPRAVSRAGGRFEAHPLRKLKEADRIIITGPRSAILAVLGDPKLGLSTFLSPLPKRPSEIEIAEAVLMPGARWLGQTLTAMRAQLPAGLDVLALHRGGQQEPALIRRMRLRAGDVVLLSGPSDAVESLEEGPELSILGTQRPLPPTRHDGKWTLVALILAVVVGASGLLPFSVSLLLAVLALVLAGKMTVQACFSVINWRILILIGGMSSFGVAMLESGAATWLAGNLLLGLDGYDPRVLLLGLGVLTILLTQPMSNAAAALTLVPVAIEMAVQVGADPRPFVVMVTLSASLSFIAPFEPALLLVYGPGDYKFRDFPRAGAPLTVLALIILLIFVPIFWPLGLAQ